MSAAGARRVVLLVPLLWVLAIGAACAAALTTFARWVLFEEGHRAWLLARLPMVAEARGVQGALLGRAGAPSGCASPGRRPAVALALQDFASDGMV
ncbi:MAG: hypothetical protein U1F25_00515 [Rubrivivax sp.]